MTVIPIILSFPSLGTITLFRSRIESATTQTYDGRPLEVEAISIDCNCRPDEFLIFEKSFVWTVTSITVLDQALLAALAVVSPGPGDGNPLDILRMIKRDTPLGRKMYSTNQLLAPVVGVPTKG